MGVKNWTNVIRWRQGHLDELEIPAIAFDMPNYINRRLSVIRTKNFKRIPLTYVTLTIGTIKRALRSNILPVLVFDGPPDRLKRNPNPELVQDAHALYRLFKKRQDPWDKEIAGQLHASPALKTYFAAHHLKELCQTIGVPAITAPSEAEMTAAALCRDGKVGTVVSSDADTILFGSLHVCKSLNFSKKELECITLEEILQHLQLGSLDQLRDLAIICGCDFHKKGLKGIGPQKGAKLLNRHRDLEGVLKARGLVSSERDEYILAREVFHEVDYIHAGMFNLILNAPIVSRLERMLTMVRGREWAEKTTDELVNLRRRFGQVQATLEAWC
jgi:5'-3' exonuclease